MNTRYPLLGWFHILHCGFPLSHYYLAFHQFCQYIDSIFSKGKALKLNNHFVCSITPLKLQKGNVIQNENLGCDVIGFSTIGGFIVNFKISCISLFMLCISNKNIL